MQNTPPLRDPLTQAAHRRQTWLQIGLPLLLGLLAVLALAIWTVLVASGGGNVSQAADTSLIFLLIPMLVMALIFLAVLAGLIYVVALIIKALPPKFYVLQGFFLNIQKTVQNVSDKLAEPTLRAKSAGAAWQSLKSSLLNRNSDNNPHSEGS